jgi:hypothetical protein
MHGRESRHARLEVVAASEPGLGRHRSIVVAELPAGKRYSPGTQHCYGRAATSLAAEGSNADQIGVRSVN